MKTRSHRSRKSSTRKVPLQQCNYHSFHSLHQWFKGAFEHLGWIYLAKCKGIKDKVSTYKNMLNRLECSIDYSLQTTVDPDIHNDLLMMKSNLAILKRSAQRIL